MTISGHKLNTETITRPPVNDLNVEVAILSCLLKYDKVRGKIFSIHPEDFYNDQHRQDFITIVDYIADNPYFDITTAPIKTDMLISYFTRPDILESKFEYYFKRLKEISALRRIEKIAYDMEKNCQENMDYIDVRNKYLAQLNEIKPYNLRDIKPAADIEANYDDVLKYDWSRHISTGYVALDEVIGGFRNSAFYAIAGVPAVGKTTFMLNIMQNILVNKYKVLFICLEMTYDEIINKFISRITNLSTSKLRGFLNKIAYGQEDLQSITNARHKVKDYGLFFAGRGGMSVSDISDRIEFLQEIDVVFIDYLQLIRPQKNKSRYEQITEISRELKLIATKFDIPVVTIASINRANVARPDKKPQLSDFRDSGNIEYDLDCALLLYREAQFHADADLSEAELYVAKNRHGKSNVKFKMQWLPEQGQFTNMEVSDER